MYILYITHVAYICTYTHACTDMYSIEGLWHLDILLPFMLCLNIFMHIRYSFLHSPCVLLTVYPRLVMPTLLVTPVRDMQSCG